MRCEKEMDSHCGALSGADPAGRRLYDRPPDTGGPERRPEQPPRRGHCRPAPRRRKRAARLPPDRRRSGVGPRAGGPAGGGPPVGRRSGGAAGGERRRGGLDRGPRHGAVIPAAAGGGQPLLSEPQLGEGAQPGRLGIHGVHQQPRSDGLSYDSLRPPDAKRQHVWDAEILPGPRLRPGAPQRLHRLLRRRVPLRRVRRLRGVGAGHPLPQRSGGERAGGGISGLLRRQLRDRPRRNAGGGGADSDPLHLHRRRPRHPLGGPGGSPRDLARRITHRAVLPREGGAVRLKRRA